MLSPSPSTTAIRMNSTAVHNYTTDFHSKVFSHSETGDIIKGIYFFVDFSCFMSCYVQDIMYSNEIMVLRKWCKTASSELSVDVMLPEETGSTSIKELLFTGSSVCPCASSFNSLLSQPAEDQAASLMKVWQLHSPVICTDYFSGPGSAIGPLSVCISMITYEQNDLI